MSNLLRSVVVAGAMAAPLASQAAGPTLGDVFKNSGITESGYISGGYSYDNRQFDSGSPYAYGGATNGAFVLNQVGLTLSSTPSEGFGGVLDILGGQAAVVTPNDNFSDIVFKQAYIQYATGPLTIMGGRFATLAGMEVIADNGNTNATRSLLFFIQPLTHTGVRAAAKLGDVFTVTGGLNNSYLGNPGYVGFTTDDNIQKTVELQVAATPKEGLSLYLTGYKGTEGAPGSQTSPSLIDFVGSFAVTKTITLGANVDHLSVDDATSTKVDGAALYANLQATDKLRFGVRGEYVKTKDSTGTLDKQKEITLTAAVAAASNFDLLADLRMDKDDAAPFGPLPATGGQDDSMLTVAIKGIYKF